MNNKTAENDTNNICCKTMQDWLRESFEILQKLSDNQIMLLFPELFDL